LFDVSGAPRTRQAPIARRQVITLDREAPIDQESAGYLGPCSVGVTNVVDEQGYVIDTIPPTPTKVQAAVLREAYKLERTFAMEPLKKQ
jgi:hypothetical protein